MLIVSLVLFIAMLSIIGGLAKSKRQAIEALKAEVAKHIAAPPASPKAMKMMGLMTPGDQKATIQVRDWEALKLGLWRSKRAWEIAQGAAEDIVRHCKHESECAGKTDESAPCRPTCPDREIRMSALVILSAGRQLAPVEARKPADGPFFAPSRERYSEVCAELAAAYAELDTLRGSAVISPTPELKEAS